MASAPGVYAVTVGVTVTGGPASGTSLEALSAGGPSRTLVSDASLTRASWDTQPWAWR